ncbi:C-Jun-amino-terminal kinase-interacting protein 4-like isoform X2 [Oppia nitens]|uniref:C-Jun-amino-terminal kinase-interacting protein 4-like isoform X2 n=1 Tax=Oppia nitens TaxID=1686743 RepID=UPI0023DBB45F|nr:C-Jun-amino-terminal kinase-interacting protein 4-like isoform X2 [Oppia nitens]
MMNDNIIMDTNANNTITATTPPMVGKLSAAAEAIINDTPDTPPLSTQTTETIYELGRQLDSPTHVVSERVQTLAAQIYTELQRIISRCNEDEDVVAGLMPLVVNVLESLDMASIENQQYQVELELCKDDNEQLVTAFEKEKLNKKKVEQRLFEFEFTTDEEKQHYQQKIDSLANIVKMLELKAKNSADHSLRLEEKEAELKKEYNKLHERYTEVLRSHCELMERVKILIGTDEGMSSLQQQQQQPPNSLPNYSIKYQNNRRQEFESSGEEFSEQLANNRRDSNSPTPIRQAWADRELTLDELNPSIIEDVDDLARDRDKDRDYPSLTVNDNFFGMEKEIQNLITENNELLATKNALNIVKDDLIAKVDELQSELTMCANEIQQRDAVKERLKFRIKELEEELKKCKEEAEETKQKLLAQKEDDEENIPMAQRKRFTRVEMARVLMERNQYKEKLIELQEAIRWSELIKATKTEGEKKSAIWKFFSNLFSTQSSPPNKDSSTASLSPQRTAVRFNSANPTAVTPALDAMRKRARAQQAASGGPGSELLLLMDSDLTSERARALRSVRAHVNRTGSGDRIQAYGWSITGTGNGDGQSGERMVNSAIKGTSVPVPIYCRPLSGDDVGMKIWCACAVDLTGGEAGFPSDKIESSAQQTDQQSAAKQQQQQTTAETPPAKDSNNALADLETELSQALSEQTSRSLDSQLSTFVWICSVSHSKSKVTIVNIRSNPGEVLDSFNVKTHLLCISSIPGAKVDDIHGSDGIDADGNAIRLVERQELITQSDGSKSSTTTTTTSTTDKKEVDILYEAKRMDESAYRDIAIEATEKGSTTLDKLSEYVAYTEPPSPTSTSDDISTTSSIFQPMSTCLPTMWTGGQDGNLYIHSSIAQWSHCIAKVKLSDSVLQIVHTKGRVFVALANGQCCVFVRSMVTGEWDFTAYYVIDIGVVFNLVNTSTTSTTTTTTSDSTNSKSNTMTNMSSSSSSATITTTTTALYSIRCIETTKDMVWLGYRNLVFILNTKTLQLVHWFAVHPRKDTQTRQMTALGDGVWVSLRLDSTLKLYSNLKPYQHLQDVDIEPYVSKMLSPKAFSFIRITALKASNHRIWIGTANGVILSIPCGGGSAHKDTVAGGGGGSGGSSSQSSPPPAIVSSSSSGRLAMSTFVPICNLSTTQLSFHGHKDAVKFFVCTKNLILSGGEGYIDFRLNGDDDSSSTSTSTSLSKGDRSHLIVWELSP